MAKKLGQLTVVPLVGKFRDAYADLRRSAQAWQEVIRDRPAKAAVASLGDGRILPTVDAFEPLAKAVTLLEERERVAEQTTAEPWVSLDDLTAAVNEDIRRARAEQALDTDAVPQPVAIVSEPATLESLAPTPLTTLPERYATVREAVMAACQAEYPDEPMPTRAEMRAAIPRPRSGSALEEMVVERAIADSSTINDENESGVMPQGIDYCIDHKDSHADCAVTRNQGTNRAIPRRPKKLSRKAQMAEERRKSDPMGRDRDDIDYSSDELPSVR